MSPLSLNGRALHWVFKIGDRRRNMDFFRNVLGMKVLRHEEFEEGCAATCNGPYNGHWSKTMVGYGPEDDHFVVELTYNYEVSAYKRGNDFAGFHIYKSGVKGDAFAKAREQGLEVEEDKGLIRSPDGYPFYVLDEALPAGKTDPVARVSVAVASLEKSVAFWSGLLGLKEVNSADKRKAVSFDVTQTSLELVETSSGVEHASAFGRVAFAVPSKQLKPIEAKMNETGNKVLTPYVSLPTPGKADVQVVIVADPDGHEICFVGAEGFRDLSQVDPKGDSLLDEAMDKDKSNEWFKRKGKAKKEV